MCPWRGKLGSWHRIPPGLGWGRGCPCIHVPALGMDGAVGLCPTDSPDPWNPQGQGCSPKGTWEQPLAQPRANTRCLSPVPQGNDVLEDEDASPTQEDGKRPWVVVVPSLSARCHRERGCCAVPSSPAAIRESPGGLRGHWRQGNIRHSRDTHGWAEHQRVGGASQARGPRELSVGRGAVGVQDPMVFPTSQVGKRLLSLCVFSLAKVFSEISETLPCRNQCLG